MQDQELPTRSEMTPNLRGRPRRGGPRAAGDARFLYMIMWDSTLGLLAPLASAAGAPLVSGLLQRMPPPAHEPTTTLVPPGSLPAGS